MCFGLSHLLFTNNKTLPRTAPAYQFVKQQEMKCLHIYMMEELCSLFVEQVAWSWYGGESKSSPHYFVFKMFSYDLLLPSVFPLEYSLPRVPDRRQYRTTECEGASSVQETEIKRPVHKYQICPCIQGHSHFPCTGLSPYTEKKKSIFQCFRNGILKHIKWEDFAHLIITFRIFSKCLVSREMKFIYDPTQ